MTVNGGRRKIEIKIGNVTESSSLGNNFAFKIAAEIFPLVNAVCCFLLHSTDNKTKTEQERKREGKAKE